MNETVKKNAAQAASALNHNSNPSLCQASTPLPGGIDLEKLFRDNRIERIVNYYSDKLISSGTFRRHEREDKQQDLRLAIFRRLPDFDPAKGDIYTFAGIVCADAYKNMLKKRDRELRRMGGFPVSIHEKPEGCDEPLENVLPEEEHGPRIGGRVLSEEEFERYEKAEAAFLASLGRYDRRIWDALVATGGNADAASRQTHIPASTILWHFKNPISAAASKAGLGEFFGGAR